MTSTEAPSTPRTAHGLAALPAVLLALLPKFACPACWPAYGSVLQALGLGSVLSSPWRLPLLAVFLLPALGLLARTGRRRRDQRPLTLGVVGAIVSLLAVALGHSTMSLLGSALFVGAMVWSSFAPKRTRTQPPIAAAQPGGGAPACCRRA